MLSYILDLTMVFSHDIHGVMLHYLLFGDMLPQILNSDSKSASNF